MTNKGSFSKLVAPLCQQVAGFVARAVLGPKAAAAGERACVSQSARSEAGTGAPQLKSGKSLTMHHSADDGAIQWKAQ